MKKREPVSKIMSSQLVTINKNTDLNEAEHLFKSKHIRHLPVVSGDELIGILSLTDLMRISFTDNYGENEGTVDTAVYNMLSIPQVMVAAPVSIQKTQTIKEAAELLASKEFHALPVLDGNELVGIVTTTDLIKYLLDQY